MTQMEIESTDNSTKKHPIGILGWLIALLLIPSSVLLGNLAAEEYFGSFYFIPLGGIFFGIIGGVIAGIMPLFAWKILEKIKIVVLIALIASIIYYYQLLDRLVILVFIPGLINSLIFFAVTRMICVSLQKSPVNWWLFIVILVIGLAITICSTGLLSFLGAGLMSQ